MKTIFLFCFALCAWPAFSQTNFQYHLQVLDNQGSVKRDIAVVFIETSTFERIETKTDGGGKLDMVFDHGKEWSVTVGDMYNCATVHSSGRGRGMDLVTYDLVRYERENRILPDRRGMQFEQVPQTLTKMAPSTGAASVVRVILENDASVLFPNIPVTLTCFATMKQYTAKTNARGEAYFQVPGNNDYEVDVDNVPSVNYVDINDQLMSNTLTILYEKKRFTEKTVDGFVEQALPGDIVASSSHAKVELTVISNGLPAQDEPVYLRTSKSSVMYRGKTNDQGKVVFMLPVRNSYLIDFTFQHDAGVINLSKVKGLAEKAMTVQYVTDPRLANIESFIPKVKDLIDYDIESFVQAQYPDPKDEVELFLKWGNKFNASSKEAVLEVGFKVNPKRNGVEAAKNIMLVVDISGSMASDDRLELLKNTLVQFINRCSAKDRIGLVVFDDAASLAFPSQLLTNKLALIQIIQTLQPRGGTNIYNGLVLGMDELMKTKSASTVNRLVLMTDGYCSVEPAVTIEKAKSYVAKGIQISAIGVGVDYNQALLSQLASVGGGLMQMAGDSKQIQAAFLKEFLSMIEPVGEKVTLEVLYNDQIVYRQLIGYNDELVTKGKMQVKFDHLFPGLEKMALIKFDIINSSPEIEKLPVKARLSYTDVVSGKQKLVEKELFPEWTTATGLLDMTLDQDHRKIIAVAIANQSMKNMSNSFERGDRAAAEKAVADGIRQIHELFPQAEPAELTSLIDKLQEYVSAFQHAKLVKK